MKITANCFAGTDGSVADGASILLLAGGDLVHLHMVVHRGSKVSGVGTGRALEGCHRQQVRRARKGWLGGIYSRAPLPRALCSDGRPECSSSGIPDRTRDTANLWSDETLLEQHTSLSAMDALDVILARVQALEDLATAVLRASIVFGQ